MDDFSQFALEISKAIEERQTSLRCACEQEQRQVQNLQELLKSIGASSDAFDKEDKDAILLEISTREASLQMINKEAKRQEELRRQKEAILMQLYTVLTTRTKVLEQADEDSAVLKQNQKLLAFFAQKQVNLMEMLKGKMKELMDAMPPPPGS